MRGDNAFWMLVCVVATVGGCVSPYQEQCKRERTRLGDDAEPAPALGFAPAAVLTWALTPRTELAEWEAPPSAFRLSQAAEGTALRYELTRANGAAVQVVYEDWCGPAPRLEIPVVARVMTSDGALSESLPGTLSAAREGFAKLAAKLPLEADAGTLAIASDDRELRLQPWFSASLTASASAGGIGVSVERSTPEATTLLPGFGVLHWPTGSACAPAVIAREIAGSDPDWALPIAAAGVASWSGTVTEGATPLSAAVTLELDGVLCEGESGEMTAPVTLRVSFADQRPGLTLQSVLVLAQDGLRLLPPPEGPGGYWGGAPDSFAARHSDLGLDLSAYDRVELQLELSLSDDGMQGSLALVGFEDACKSSTCGPHGCNGCGPLLPVVLLELHPQPPP